MMDCFTSPIQVLGTASPQTLLHSNRRVGAHRNARMAERVGDAAVVARRRIGPDLHCEPVHHSRADRSNSSGLFQPRAAAAQSIRQSACGPAGGDSRWEKPAGNRADDRGPCNAGAAGAGPAHDAGGLHADRFSRQVQVRAVADIASCDQSSAQLAPPPRWPPAAASAIGVSAVHWEDDRQKMKELAAISADRLSQREDGD